MGEEKALALSLKLMSETQEDDILGAMGELVCSGETAMLTRLARPDGGWAVEDGGQSEMWGTLMALECLLRMKSPPSECGRGWNWLMEKVSKDGGRLCGHGGNDERVVCQLLSVAGEARRHGWGLDAKSRRILAEMEEWFENQWCVHKKTETFSVYDMSLALKGLYLLGRHDQWEVMAHAIVDLQMEDGHWHDGTVADDWLVTCTAVDALGCWLTPMSDGDGPLVEWAVGGDAQETAFGAREYAEMKLSGELVGKVVTLEVRMGEELVDFVYAGEVMNGSLGWFTGTHGGGEYEMRVVIWDDDCGGWLGEVVLPFHIREDMRCCNMKWENPMRDKSLYAGEAWRTGLSISWEYDGNTDVEAALAWRLSKEGVTIAEGQGNVALVHGKHYCRYDFAEEKSFYLEEPGRYVLTGQLVNAQGEYSCSRIITVVAGIAYDVVNEVSPKEITLGASRLRHILKVRCTGEEIEETHEAGFTVMGKERQLVDVLNEWLEIELGEIYGSDGRKIDSGWLAIQSYYGHCEGDRNLAAGRLEGFLCAVQVVAGKARFRIGSEDRMKKGVFGVTVYQLNDVERGEVGGRLGQFDVYLIDR